ncbi:MAG: alpha/beta fold hydrolase [bacterium]
MKNFRKIFSILMIVFLCVFLVNTDASFAKKKKKGPVELDIQVRDGFHIIGLLDKPKKTTVKNKVPLVIFLHSIGEDSTEWGTFPSEVKDKLKVATLNVDLRGHGKSILNKNSRKIHWQNFQDKTFGKFPYDVVDILKYIKDQHPEIDSSRVAIVGASLGANTALMAGSYGVNIKTIIMLSPMLQYKGFDLRLPIVKYGNHPLLFMVSKKDRYPYQSCIELIKFAQGKKLLKSYPFGGSGVNLVKFQPDAKPLITNWINESFFPQPKKVK